MLRNKLIILLAVAPLLAHASLLTWGRVAESAAGARHYRNENFLQAEQLWGRLAATLPEDGRLQYNIGCALYRLDRIDEALTAFQRSLADEDFASAARAWRNIGRIHAERQQYREAWLAYRQSLLADPTDDDARRDMELVARYLVTLTGDVRDADTGEPLPGVAIRLVEQDEPAVASGPQGQWLLHRRTEPGTVTVESALDGYVTVRKRVEADFASGPISISMEKVLTVTGHVLDSETGEPVSGAEVLARGVETPPDTTDADGAFTLAGLASRTYAFEANAEGYLPFAQPIEVSRGDTLVEISLKPAVTLTGTVVDLYTGEPIPGAAVRALESDSPGATSDYDGSFALQRLEAGKTYTLNAFDADYAELRQPVKAKRDMPPVTLKLKPGLPLRGMVVDANDGSPVANAVVLVDSSSVAPDTTDVNGAFRLFGFDEATYTLMAYAPGYAGVAFDKTISRSDTTMTIPLPTAIEVSGIVYDADTGQELEGALVRSPGWPVRPDTTSVRGYYRLDGFWTGEYPFQVTAKHYFPLNETHEVTRDAHTFDFQLHINITVQGTVFDADTGQPIEGAKVEVQGVENSPATTDFEGHYALAGFREQSYPFKVSAEGYQPAQEEHDVDRDHYVFDFYLHKADQQDQQDQQQQQQNQDQQNQDQQDQQQSEQQNQEQQQQQQPDQQQQDQQQQQAQQQQQSQASEADQQEAQQQAQQEKLTQEQKDAAEKVLMRLLQKEQDAKDEEKRQRRTSGSLRGRYW